MTMGIDVIESFLGSTTNSDEQGKHRANQVQRGILFQTVCCQRHRHFQWVAVEVKRLRVDDKIGVDVTGRLVYLYNNTSLNKVINLDLSDLESGNYLLKATIDNISETYRLQLLD